MGGGIVFVERSPIPRRKVDGVDFFRALADVLPGVVYQSRIAPDGHAQVEYVSGAVRWMFECQPDDIMRDVQVFRNLIHPEDRERFHRLVAEQLHRPGFWHLEYRLLLPSGRVIWISSHASIQLEPSGDSIWRGFFTDITERKRAEAELQAERERLALATQAGRIGTWDYDVRTGAIRWNDEQYAIHGVTRENYQPGETNYEFLAPEEQARVRAEFERALVSGATQYAMDVELHLPDGRKRLTRSQALILRDASGGAVRVVGIEVDITEEKRAEAAMARAKEAAEAADRAKSEFLATMSHEIRTPMNGVLGYAELLRSTPLNPEQREFVDTIETSGQHLLAVINDVLDVSRIEAGKLHVKLAPFDLPGSVRETFEMLRPVAEKKGLGYFCEIEAAAPAGVIGDQARIAQILTNILGNAIKFTDAGEVRLEVTAEPVATGEEWRWNFQVNDTGPGIAPEALEQIFQPFYQVDGSSERRHGGTGLGLAISRRIANLLDGSLEAGNRPEGGSTFVFSLNTRLAPNMADSPPIAAQGIHLEGMRVLVAEDNATNRRLCEIQLERLGSSPHFAETGLEAVEIFRSGRFDVVLMDMQMPDMDGCAATREIRRFERMLDRPRTPIIAMTANARAEDQNRCLAAGMDDYLSKPLRQEVLASALEKWARGSTREA